jgi:hypothetical protein
VNEPIRSTARSGGLLGPNDPVLEGVVAGPKYGDDVWDLRSVIRRESQSERTLDFRTVPGTYQQSLRDVLVVLAQPTHPVVLAAGIARRGTHGSVATLVDSFRRLRTLAVWGSGENLPDFSSWTQQDADKFVASMRSGHHREGGAVLGPGTVRKFVQQLKLVRACGPVMPGGGLPFQPWGARSASTVAEEVTSYENKTPPLPWETWGPAVAAAWTIVDKFSADILTASTAAANLASERRGDRAWARLQEWAKSGGVLPLHTGFGRATGRRGHPNVGLLCRQLHISDTFLNHVSWGFEPAGLELVQEMANDPARSTYGGLVQPTVMVTHPNGTATPWVAEIGLGEREYLDSVLRAACYVILAALTGMRDSEIQALTKVAVTTRDGLPALLSRQYKGNDSEGGEERGWWAPAPVLRTVEVLTALSPHMSHLLARSATNLGSYAPSRDIPRFLEFVNGDPATRAGRGQGLGLAPIYVDDRTSINSRTLRRSFSVYAVTRPAAELGLGIQLGHAAWRTTTGYAADGQQAATHLFDEERKNVMRQQAAALVGGTGPVAGKQASTVLALRAQVISDPGRADRIAAQVGDKLHLGVTNDCMYASETAACGPDGPFLGDHICGGDDCANALFTLAHKQVLEGSIARMDSYLDAGRGNDVLIERMRRDRARLVRLVRELSNEPAEGGTQ